MSDNNNGPPASPSRGAPVASVAFDPTGLSPSAASVSNAILLGQLLNHQSPGSRGSYRAGGLSPLASLSGSVSISSKDSFVSIQEDMLDVKLVFNCSTIPSLERIAEEGLKNPKNSMFAIPPSHVEGLARKGTRKGAVAKLQIRQAKTARTQLSKRELELKPLLEEAETQAKKWKDKVDELTTQLSQVESEKLEQTNVLNNARLTFARSELIATYMSVLQNTPMCNRFFGSHPTNGVLIQIAVILHLLEYQTTENVSQDSHHGLLSSIYALVNLGYPTHPHYVQLQATEYIQRKYPAGNVLTTSNATKDDLAERLCDALGLDPPPRSEMVPLPSLDENAPYSSPAITKRPLFLGNAEHPAAKRQRLEQRKNELEQRKNELEQKQIELAAETAQVNKALKEAGNDGDDAGTDSDSK